MIRTALGADVAGRERTPIHAAGPRDAAEPALWIGRALLQEAQGLPQMARASVNYALAIWSDADADYVHYQEAVELAERLSKAVER